MGPRHRSQDSTRAKGFRWARRRHGTPHHAFWWGASTVPQPPAQTRTGGGFAARARRCWTRAPWVLLTYRLPGFAVSPQPQRHGPGSALLGGASPARTRAFLTTDPQRSEQNRRTPLPADGGNGTPQRGDSQRGDGSQARQTGCAGNTSRPPHSRHRPARTGAGKATVRREPVATRCALRRAVRAVRGTTFPAATSPTTAATSSAAWPSVLTHAADAWPRAAVGPSRRMTSPWRTSWKSDRVNTVPATISRTAASVSARTVSTKSNASPGEPGASACSTPRSG